MPKIIPNVREQLLKEAKRQIEEYGYGKMTIRSVASACDLGVGTVYNYFKSKDRLVATFMAEDWLESISQIQSQPGVEPKEVLHSIYNALIDFASRYQTLFSDREAAKTFASVFTERHKQLRRQLTEFIVPVCQGAAPEDRRFVAEFIAESLLAWTMEGVPFEKQYAIICKIIQ